MDESVIIVDGKEIIVKHDSKSNKLKGQILAKNRLRGLDTVRGKAKKDRNLPGKKQSPFGKKKR